jgi:predicted nucleic-acid-binding Zn-ribbon protein
MVRYKKRTPEEVLVKGNKLVCPVCHHDQFIETKAQMNTAIASLLDLDWTNKEARCFVCSECTYVFWFRT